jgi:hypothetical protein
VSVVDEAIVPACAVEGLASLVASDLIVERGADDPFDVAFDVADVDRIGPCPVGRDVIADGQVTTLGG